MTGPAPELRWAVMTMGVVTVGYLAAARDGRPLPGDLLGHLLGIAGFLLMAFAMVGYSWRKRPNRSGPGPMVRWLQLHAFAGLVGPYLVLLHSAFQFHGLAAVLALLLLVVVLSGITGKYGPASATAVAPSRGALWYILHVPLSGALAVLAVFHVVGALYYRTGGP